MKKLVQAVASLIIATSSFAGVTTISAKENTQAYKVEYQDADSIQSVFSKELHKNMRMLNSKRKQKMYLYMNQKF